MDKKIKALAKFLGIDTDNIEVNDYGSFDINCDCIDENTCDVDGAEYLVLTDDEADEKAKQEIIESLWAFNSEFILSCSGLS